jgi:hypothetical protein
MGILVALPAASLEQVIAGIRGLDREDIRAKVAESQTASVASSAPVGAKRTSMSDTLEPPWLS